MSGFDRNPRRLEYGEAAADQPKRHFGGLGGMHVVGLSPQNRRVRFIADMDVARYREECAPASETRQQRRAARRLAAKDPDRWLKNEYRGT